MDVCRNEVDDDEVDFMISGLRGNMKQSIVANLWDECGNGNLKKCYTYWLRRLMNHLYLWHGCLTT
ncbi:MAG: iron-containing redox enzyme family protein [Flavobacteriales bacterium]